MKINLPVILSASDYHDFDFLEDSIKQIIPNIKYEELGFSGAYYAVFYTGKIPSLKWINENFQNEDGMKCIKVEQQFELVSDHDDDNDE